MRASVEELADHMRVIAHVGAPSLYEVLGLLAQARDVGAKEVAVVTPYYLPVTDKSLFDFYRAVTDAADGLDVFIYLYRKRTGNFIDERLMARLAELPHIIGVKISEERLEQIAAFRAAVPSEEFTIYTGADRDLGRAADFGAQGVISGVSSVLPKPFRALAAATDSGDPAVIATAQAAVDEVVDAVAGDMARMKAVYRLLGIPGGTTRMAIEPPTDEVVARLSRAVELYG